LAGTGSILFSGGLFWRQLRFGGNWLHIIFQWIVLEAAQIWWELAPHYFPADDFAGSSDLAETGSTLFSVGLFWRRLPPEPKTDTTQQHNWKKGSSSPCKAGVFDSLSVILSASKG
jgi:hypothetical protein